MIEPHLTDETPSVSDGTLRQFAVASLVFFGALASWQGFARHHVWTAVILAGVALYLGSVGLISPARIRPVFMGLSALTRPIGMVVSRLLLGALFYGLFAPIALIFRVLGRDVLHIRLPDRPSHWTAKPEVTDVRDYTRQ